MLVCLTSCVAYNASNVGNCSNLTTDHDNLSCPVCSWLFKNPLPCHLFSYNSVQYYKPHNHGVITELKSKEDVTEAKAINPL